jgi:hypothetical protein
MKTLFNPAFKRMAKVVYLLVCAPSIFIVIYGTGAYFYNSYRAYTLREFYWDQFEEVKINDLPAPDNGPWVKYQDHGSKLKADELLEKSRRKVGAEKLTAAKQRKVDTLNGVLVFGAILLVFNLIVASAAYIIGGKFRIPSSFLDFSVKN